MVTYPPHQQISDDNKLLKGPLEPDYTPDDLKVGQIWKCIENENIILISLVRPKELRGYMFNGFEVVPYYSLAPYDFCRYWKLERERKN